MHINAFKTIISHKHSPQNMRRIPMPFTAQNKFHRSNKRRQVDEIKRIFDFPNL